MQTYLFQSEVMAKFASWLVFTDHFAAVDLTQFIVGHTHNEQDERFSKVVIALTRAECLQDPEQFCDRIDECCSGLRGRTQVVERLHASYDF